MGTYLPRVLLHPVGKVAVLTLALTLAGLSAWGATQSTTRFDQNWYAQGGAVGRLLVWRERWWCLWIWSALACSVKCNGPFVCAGGPCRRFIPDDSHVQSALDIQDSQFGGQALGFSYYTGARHRLAWAQGCGPLLCAAAFCIHLAGDAGGLASDGSALFVNYTALDTQEALDNLIADTLADEDVRDCDNAW
jgi:hypothetical protein